VAQHDVFHPPPSGAEKKRVELYLSSFSRPSRPVIGRNLPLPLPCYFVKFEIVAAVTVNVTAFSTLAPCAEKPATHFVGIDEYLIMDDAACYFDT